MDQAFVLGFKSVPVGYRGQMFKFNGTQNHVTFSELFPDFVIFIFCEFKILSQLLRTIKLQ